MNKYIAEAEGFCRDFLPRVKDIDDIEVVICPPFTCLYALKAILEGSDIKLGAQNLFWKENGPYTGEISPSMLADAGCSYVIIGHSERRQIMGESDVIINRKIKAAIEAGLIPILCVGETLQERENNQAMEVVKKQLSKDLEDIFFAGKLLVIAYEPVWAIGTGLNASACDAQEMIKFIRGCLNRMYDEEVADSVRILYGGSVKEENIAEFLAEDDVDGALVGGASLQVDSFARIVRLGQNE